jgi:hypothetical protein
MSYIPNGLRIYQPFPFEGPPKFIQIGIFGFQNIPSGNPGLLCKIVLSFYLFGGILPSSMCHAIYAFLSLPLPATSDRPHLLSFSGM